MRRYERVSTSYEKARKMFYFNIRDITKNSNILFWVCQISYGNWMYGNKSFCDFSLVQKYLFFLLRVLLRKVLTLYYVLAYMIS